MKSPEITKELINEYQITLNPFSEKVVRKAKLYVYRDYLGIGYPKDDSAITEPSELHSFETIVECYPDRWHTGIVNMDEDGNFLFLVNDPVKTNLMNQVETVSACEEIQRLLERTKNRKKILSIDTNIWPSLFEYRQNIAARNQSYWSSHFSLIPQVFNFDEMPKNSEQRKSYLRELFQFSITALIAGEDSLSRQLATFVWEQQHGIPTLSRKPDDIMIAYILERIVTRVDHLKILDKAYSLLKEELIRIIMSLEAHDLYMLCSKNLPEMITPDRATAAASFSPKASSVHDYEIVADHFVRIAKVLILRGCFDAAQSFAEDAEELYKMLSEESVPGESGSEEPFESRENSRIFISQARILSHLAKFVTLLKSKSVDGIKDLISDILRKIELFHSRYLNPRDKLESKLGFIEELEWALILHLLFFHFFGMDVSYRMGDIFRDYLG